MKRSYQTLRDQYVEGNQMDKQLQQMRRCEREKIKWKRLQKVFRKTRMKSISAIKYKVNGTIIRSSSQLQIKKGL